MVSRLLLFSVSLITLAITNGQTVTFVPENCVSPCQWSSPSIWNPPIVPNEDITATVIVASASDVEIIATDRERTFDRVEFSGPVIVQMSKLTAQEVTLEGGAAVSLSAGSSVERITVKDGGELGLEGAGDPEPFSVTEFVIENGGYSWISNGVATIGSVVNAGTFVVQNSQVSADSFTQGVSPFDNWPRTGVFGTIVVQNPVTVNIGYIAGSGTFEAPSFELIGGVFAPTDIGNDDVVLDIIGDVVIHEEGGFDILDLEKPGVVNISGNAQIAGSVYIFELGSIRPKPSDRYTLLTTSGTLTGTFEGGVICDQCEAAAQQPLLWEVQNTTNQIDILAVCNGTCCIDHLGVPDEAWNYVLTPIVVCNLIEKLEKTYSVVEYIEKNFDKNTAVLPQETIELMATIYTRFLQNCLGPFCIEGGNALNHLVQQS